MTEHIQDTRSLDRLFQEKFEQPRYGDYVSGQMELKGKTAVAILIEYTMLWKERHTDYAPETLLDALVRFGTERQATVGDIVRVALEMGRTFPFDCSQKHFQIRSVQE